MRGLDTLSKARRAYYLIVNALESLNNPLYLSRRFSWLYWKIYDLTWSRSYWLFSNPIARSSILLSVVGYAIFLSDLVVNNYGFDAISSKQRSVLGFDSREKLVLIYFGILFISFARGIFLLRRPNTIKLGPSQSEWVAFGLREFTYGDFLRLHGDIQHNQHRTLYGKYYTDDW